MTPPIRLGVIGAGRIAQVAHLPAVAKVADVRLVAVADPSKTLAAQVAARYGVGKYQDPADLLASGVDAVLIAAPDRLHRELGLAALKSGVHVLMEKPLAPNAAEARELAEYARTAGLVLQTGAMKRHDPGLRYARDKVSEIGEIHSMAVWYRVMAGLRPEVEATLFPQVAVDEAVRRHESAHKADRASYLLTTHGAHVFDQIEFLAGPVAWVSARMAEVRGDYTWHGVCGLARHPGLVSFEITAAVHAPLSEGTRIYGSAGAITTSTDFPFFRRASDVQVFVEAEREARVPAFGRTDPYELQLEAFVRAVRQCTEPDPSPQESVRAVEMIEAVGRSCAAGGQEQVL